MGIRGSMTGLEKEREGETIGKNQVEFQGLE